MHSSSKTFGCHLHLQVWNYEKDPIKNSQKVATPFPHYKSYVVFFSGDQGQLTPQSVVGSGPPSNFHLVLITCKYKNDRMENNRERVATPSVAMEFRVRHLKSDCVRLAGLKNIHCVFESVNTQTHTRTDGRWLDSYPIRSAEQKCHVSMLTFFKSWI